MIKTFKDSTLCLIRFGKIKIQHDLWKSNLPLVQPFYAIKCNPDVEIINYMFKNLGMKSYDCASQREIETVLSITNEPSQIIYANPCKRISSLQYCHNTYERMMMTFDSVEELKKIEKYCPNAQLVLRIKGDDSGSVCKFNSKFGVDHNECLELLRTARELNLDIMGISFHVGSGCNNPLAYYTTLFYCKTVIDQAKLFDYTISMIDIGGGFVATKPKLFSEISSVISKSIRDFKLYDMKFIGEPGRFMVETSHSLVLKLINKKFYEEKGEKKMIYYVSDGLYGSLNNVIYDHSVLKLDYPTKYKTAPHYKCTVFGPTCDSFDKLGEFELPDMDLENDAIIINNMGAYTVSAGSEFNGMPLPIKIYKH